MSAFLLSFFPSFFLLSPWWIQNIDIFIQPVFAMEQEVAPACITSHFPILMYHHIREYDEFSDMAAKNLSVSPGEFKEQLNYLAKNWYHSITTKDIVKNSVPCKSVMITFDDGYYDVYKNAFPLMKEVNYTGVVGLILWKIDESDYLFWPDIIELHKANWEIASHTWNHLILTQLSQNALNRQIRDSKKDLEKWFHVSIQTFVYPGGFYGVGAMKTVAQSGYRYAFSTRFWEANLLDHRLKLNRINIPPGITVEQFSELLEKAANNFKK